MESRGLPLPTKSDILKKAKEIDQSKNFQFNDNDIDKVRIMINVLEGKWVYAHIPLYMCTWALNCG